MDDSALALAKLINSGGFQRKLNDLLEAKKVAEAAQAAAEKAKKDADDTVAAMTELSAREKADLYAAKVEHDKSANEASLRIKLAESVRQGLDDRAAELDKRLANLELREKQVDAAHNHFTGALRQLGLTAS